jgi:molybdate transport system substrate-binding protein
MQYIGICTGLALLSAALAFGGCGSERTGTETPLTVSAAASLTDAFEAYGEVLPGGQRFSFAGSDELAAQIRQGARPDVFASANTGYPEELAAAGLIEDPVVFAQSRLAIAVAPGAPIDSIEDLAEPGLDLVICAKGVPCGDYTLQVLGRLSPSEREALLGNVRAEESDVKGVVGKVAQGAADAGFVYASDIAAAADKVKEIGLPAGLEPRVAYSAAVVKGADQPEAAREFIDGLLDGEGRTALNESGFLPPP